MTANLLPEQRIRRYLQLVATGPELSKSLNAEQAKDAMTMILDGDIDPIQAGIFLIALRMKRETDAENLGVLEALQDKTVRVTSNRKQIVAIADPFNGFVRGLTSTPFLPAVLSACGIGAYVHGVEQAGPKYGITAHRVLAAAGKNVSLSSPEASNRLDHDDIGWSYIDQKSYIPQLHGLIDLRDKMVKRCCLSTLEVILKPISGAEQTHLLTGFVHKAYPPVYEMLSRAAGFDSLMLVKGVEGGAIPSLSQLSRYFGYLKRGELQLNRLSPKDLNIDQSERAPGIPSQLQPLIETAAYQQTDLIKPIVEHNAAIGLDALNSQSGPMLDSLIYGAAIVLFHTKREGSLLAGADAARAAIKSGKALSLFENG